MKYLYFNQNFIKIFKKLLKITLVLTLLIILPFNIFSLYFSLSRLSNQQPSTAIVFGAAIIKNKTPGAVLKERLDLAFKLYKNGEIENILVSGDNRTNDYNEPKVMKNYLIKSGIPAASIYPDFGGLRTIDTCYRAKKYFNIKKAVLITQAFHLPRAMSICASYGMEVEAGVAADSRKISRLNNLIRETAASWGASFNLLTNYKPSVKTDGNEINFDSL